MGNGCFPAYSCRNDDGWALSRVRSADEYCFKLHCRRLPHWKYAVRDHMVTMERVLERYEITCRMLLHFYRELERERALETLPMTQPIDDMPSWIISH